MFATVKTLLVDDHEVVRKGLRQLLDDYCEICGEASNGVEAIEKVRVINPDLILMDISMPLMNGIEATRQIRLQGFPTRIVILSMHDSSEMFRFAREAGADACLVKTSSAEELRKTILAVLKQSPQGMQECRR
jgi:DNA-binding NarL/FixJ family response regulator